MKPDDKNALLTVNQRPFRILIIAGSGRKQYNCPGIDSKARMLMLKMAAMLPQEWEIDYEDLSIAYGRAHIQSCNACENRTKGIKIAIWQSTKKFIT